MTENELKEQIAKFMKKHGWRRFRRSVGVFRYLNREEIIRIGKPGEEDLEFHRPVSFGLVNVCHVETKRTKGKARKNQLEMIALNNHLGEPSMWCDNMEDFERWYVATWITQEAV